MGTLSSTAKFGKGPGRERSDRCRLPGRYTATNAALHGAVLHPASQQGLVALVPPLMGCNNLGDNAHLFVSGFIRGMDGVDGGWVDGWMEVDEWLAALCGETTVSKVLFRR